MSNCINEVVSWLTLNDLMCNGQKTDFIICGTRQQLAKLENPQIEIGNCTIQPSEKVRNLGVIFDQNMTLTSQASKMSQAAYHQLFNIMSLRKSLTKEATSACIHAFVSSKLDTCNALLYGLPKCCLNKLQKVQNAAARLLTNTKKRDHIRPVLDHLHWLPVKGKKLGRPEFKVLTMTFKAYIGLGPDSIRDLIEPYNPSHGLRSSSHGYLLKERKTELKTGGDRAFSHAAPKSWNRLPLSIRSLKTVSSFKSALKTYFFRIEYD